MPFYSRLRYAFRDRAERTRVITNIEAISRQLDLEMPDKDADGSLLIATWNIRDFGKTGSRFGKGKREPESHYYIAEILSRFDFIAVQEVNELDELLTVLSILGPDWDYIATDVTDRSIGGNGERLTYLYDRRKMRFGNISGEIVLPQSMLISSSVVDTSEGKQLVGGKQFRRTPFVTSFQSGWFKFDICTVHLYYGSETGPELAERVEEIDRIARYFGKRAEDARKVGKTLILLGDFNIMHPEHETMKALLAAGFSVPSTLRFPTNFGGTKYYDQIAFMGNPEVIAYLEQPAMRPKDRNAGVLNVFESLYRHDQWRDYIPQMRRSPEGAKATSDDALEDYFDDWLTYQLSDHRPVWARVKVNDTARYLAKLKEV